MEHTKYTKYLGTHYHTFKFTAKLHNPQTVQKIVVWTGLNYLIGIGYTVISTMNDMIGMTNATGLQRRYG